MKNWKLRSKLVGCLIICIIIPLTIVGTISYFITASVIEKNINTYILQTLKQANYNLDTIINDVNDLSLFIIANSDVNKLLKTENMSDNSSQELKNRVERDFVNLCDSKSYIESIILINNKGQNFQYGQQALKLNYDFIRKNALGEGMYNLSNAHTQDYMYIGKKSVISFTRQLNDIDSFKKVGIASIDIDQSYINGIYDYLTLGSTGQVFLINQKGDVISTKNEWATSNYKLNSKTKKLLFKSLAGYYRETINEKDMLIAYNTSEKTGWKVVQIVPYKDVMKQGLDIRNYTIILAILFSILAAIIAIKVASKMTTPLYNLMFAMAEVEKGKFDMKVQVETEDEVGKLSRGFNSMIQTISELIDKVYKTEIRAKEAQLNALQSQINPHFLYNTLDTIYWMGRIEQAPKTSEMTQALSELFRLSLGNGGCITSIEKEKEYLESYLTIQKIRYDGKLDIQVDIDYEIYQFPIVKMTLQPIVENAIIHGISEGELKGLIKIKGFRENENIIFYIEDNGKGMDEKNIMKALKEENKKTNGIGIKNVNDRIKLYFGKKYGLKIKSELNKGTRISLIIPAITNIDLEGKKNEALDC
ncbi:cache domain-containing sensor histidine kinase [Clostridium oryzae]|uniref:Sensor histidine kinase YehU n=1 Tax=Clostridium oryzae TaxID=1450648 RepID=A0A1V4II51_9CLOT|nr:sensor histidine kinase [Clostridium oryzae]OPJ59633.1 sensor histidine kinase YehU [Clostridium oryzae]